MGKKLRRIKQEEGQDYNQLYQSTGAVQYTDCIFTGGLRHRNECSGYNTKQSDGDVPVMLELWGTYRTPSLPPLPGSLWRSVVAHDRVLSIGQTDPNCVLVLNRVAYNRTVLICKLYTKAKLNCLKWNCFCMLNWIVLNWTAFDIETVLTLNWIVWNRNALKFYPI